MVQQEGLSNDLVVAALARKGFSDLHKKLEATPY
jgi:hypothetical protein